MVDDELRVDPKLPGAWRRVSFPLMWRGQPLKVTAERDRVTVENGGTAPVRVTLRGGKATVMPGERIEA